MLNDHYGKAMFQISQLYFGSMQERFVANRDLVSKPFEGTFAIPLLLLSLKSKDHTTRLRSAEALTLWHRFENFKGDFWRNPEQKRTLYWFMDWLEYNLKLEYHDDSKKEILDILEGLLRTFSAQELERAWLLVLRIIFSQEQLTTPFPRSKLFYLSHQTKLKLSNFAQEVSFEDWTEKQLEHKIESKLKGIVQQQQLPETAYELLDFIDQMEGLEPPTSSYVYTNQRETRSFTELKDLFPELTLKEQLLLRKYVRIIESLTDPSLADFAKLQPLDSLTPPEDVLDDYDEEALYGGALIGGAAGGAPAGRAPTGAVSVGAPPEEFGHGTLSEQDDHSEEDVRDEESRARGISIESSSEEVEKKQDITLDYKEDLQPKPLTRKAPKKAKKRAATKKQKRIKKEQEREEIEDGVFPSKPKPKAPALPYEPEPVPAAPPSPLKAEESPPSMDAMPVVADPTIDTTGKKDFSHMDFMEAEPSKPKLSKEAFSDDKSLSPEDGEFDSSDDVSRKDSEEIMAEIELLKQGEYDEEEPAKLEGFEELEEFKELEEEDLEQELDAFLHDDDTPVKLGAPSLETSLDMQPSQPRLYRKREAPLAKEQEKSAEEIPAKKRSDSWLLAPFKFLGWLFILPFAGLWYLLRSSGRLFYKLYEGMIGLFSSKSQSYKEKAKEKEVAVFELFLSDDAVTPGPFERLMAQSRSITRFIQDTIGLRILLFVAAMDALVDMLASYISGIYYAWRTMRSFQRRLQRKQSLHKDLADDLALTRVQIARMFTISGFYLEEVQTQIPETEAWKERTKGSFPLEMALELRSHLDEMKRDLQILTMKQGIKFATKSMRKFIGSLVPNPLSVLTAWKDLMLIALFMRYSRDDLESMYANYLRNYMHTIYLLHQEQKREDPEFSPFEQEPYQELFSFEHDMLERHGKNAPLESIFLHKQIDLNSLDLQRFIQLLCKPEHLQNPKKWSRYDLLKENLKTQSQRCLHPTAGQELDQWLAKQIIKASKNTQMEEQKLDRESIAQLRSDLYVRQQALKMFNANHRF